MNPYDKAKNEAAYLSWENGFNSLDKNDNPYADLMDDPEATKLSSIWLQGFNANKNRVKPVKPNPIKEVIEEQTNNLTVVGLTGTNNLSLQDIPTEVLLKEVSKRMAEFEQAVKKFKQVFG